MHQTGGGIWAEFRVAINPTNKNEWSITLTDKAIKRIEPLSRYFKKGIIDGLKEFIEEKNQRGIGLKGIDFYIENLSYHPIDSKPVGFKYPLLGMLKRIEKTGYLANEIIEIETSSGFFKIEEIDLVHSITLSFVRTRKTSPNCYRILRSYGNQIFLICPSRVFYMEEIAYEAYHTNRGILVQFGTMAIFALFLSLTGLYSIVSLNINKRNKEIGIRKVFGASISSIMRLIQHEFGIILIIAVAIGCSGGYYFMNKFLSDIFSYHQKVGFDSFAYAAGMIIMLTALTSGIKIYKASPPKPN